MSVDITNKELCDISIKAQENAYAPYSGFRVGAALLCEDGTVYTGCNVENASYGATLCAERCAISKAVSDGRRDFVKIAITGSDGNFTMPCGICRQVLAEFMSEGLVITTNKSEIKTYKVKELIPECFSLGDKNDTKKGE